MATNSTAATIRSIRMKDTSRIFYSEKRRLLPMPASSMAPTSSHSVLSFPGDEYVQRITRLHLDPRHGTPYWVERDRRLGAQAIDRVRTFDEFKRLVGFRDAREKS